MEPKLDVDQQPEPSTSTFFEDLTAHRRDTVMHVAQAKPDAVASPVVESPLPSRDHHAFTRLRPPGKNRREYQVPSREHAGRVPLSIAAPVADLYARSELQGEGFAEAMDNDVDGFLTQMLLNSLALSYRKLDLYDQLDELPNSWWRRLGNRLTRRTLTSLIKMQDAVDMAQRQIHFWDIQKGNDASGVEDDRLPGEPGSYVANYRATHDLRLDTMLRELMYGLVFDRDKDGKAALGADHKTPELKLAYETVLVDGDRWTRLSFLRTEIPNMDGALLAQKMQDAVWRPLTEGQQRHPDFANADLRIVLTKHAEYLTAAAAQDDTLLYTSTHGKTPMVVELGMDETGKLMRDFIVKYSHAETDAAFGVREIGEVLRLADVDRLSTPEVRLPLRLEEKERRHDHQSEVASVRISRATWGQFDNWVQQLYKRSRDLYRSLKPPGLEDEKDLLNISWGTVLALAVALTLDIDTEHFLEKTGSSLAPSLLSWPSKIREKMQHDQELDIADANLLFGSLGLWMTDRLDTMKGKGTIPLMATITGKNRPLRGIVSGLGKLFSPSKTNRLTDAVLLSFLVGNAKAYSQAQDYVSVEEFTTAAANTYPRYVVGAVDVWNEEKRAWEINITLRAMHPKDKYDGADLRERQAVVANFEKRFKDNVFDALKILDSALSTVEKAAASRKAA